MVRKYVRNLGRSPLDPGAVEAALETIKASTMSIRKASKNFGINEATLRDKLKHVDSQRGCTGWHGVVTAIPKEESEFAYLLTLKSKWGFASTREEVKYLVQKYVQTNKNLDTPVSKHLW